MKDLSITATYTDLYQISMSQVYYLTGKSRQEAVFDYFFRKLPFGGGYAIFCGLGDLLNILEDLHFSEDDISYLKSLGLNEQFATSLQNFKFRGTVYTAREGEVVFPNEPIIRVEATILEAQLIETILLNIINFQSLIA